jgi:hypothetical protein
MKNDKGGVVKTATPGTAVHVTGFKHYPEAGHPLWTVSDPEIAKYISTRVRDKKDQLKH